MAATVSRLFLIVFMISELSLVVAPMLVSPSHAAILVPPDFHDALVSSVTFPIDMAWTPDGRMLVIGHGGNLWVYASNETLLAQSLYLGNVLCTHDEWGLKGIAVHPDFVSNHYIYLYYTFQKFGTCDASPMTGPVDRLSRFTLPDTNLIDRNSEVVLLETAPLQQSNHLGGDLKFGNDGYLYLSIGDEGSGSNCCGFYNRTWARDPGILFGKILRLTDSGGIPPDNPFAGPGTARCNVGGAPPSGSPNGTKCQEVYAMGLRNPWRFAFDPNTLVVRSFINDAGEDTWEEIDQLKAGADYGWSVREGPCAYGSTTDCGAPPGGVTNPIYWYSHNVTAMNGYNCTVITGGAFVPNGIWPASFEGGFLLSDFDCGQIWAITPNGQNGYLMSDFATLERFGPISFRFGPLGSTQALYYTTLVAGGQIRRITYDAPPIVSFSQDKTNALPGELITLTINGSDPDGTIAQTLVDWGDGTIHMFPSLQTSDAHRYVNPGCYTISITLTDNVGGASSSTSSITISDCPPIAMFSESTKRTVALTPIGFDASSSRDPDGVIVSYAWEFGDGTWGLGVTVTHAYSRPGNYMVSLTVTDDAGNTAVKTVVMDIQSIPPAVSITTGTRTVEAGQSVTIIITVSDPDGSITSIMIDWGDGTVDSRPTTSTTGSHTYGKEGIYTVTVKVTDDNGAASTSVTTLNVDPRSVMLYDLPIWVLPLMITTAAVALIVLIRNARGRTKVAIAKGNESTAKPRVGLASWRP